MKFRDYLVEMDFTYKVPDDKQHRLFDFYMLTALPDPAEETLNYDLKFAREKVMSALIDDFESALQFSVAAEFAHLFDSNNAEDIKEFFEKNGMNKFLPVYAKVFGRKDINTSTFDEEQRKNLVRVITQNSTGYVNNLKAVEEGLKAQGMDWSAFMHRASIAFLNLSYATRFGGKSWSMIALAYNKLKEAKNYGNKMVAIDHVYDLQHNSGTIFTKIKDYYKKGVGHEWLAKALDKKRDARELYDLYQDVSPQLKPFISAVLYDGGTLDRNKKETLEDWLKTHKWKEEKSKQKEEKPVKYKLGKKGKNGLSRIINIKTGKEGGFVESEKNLSHEGTCWIADDAEVSGEGRVAGAARVYGKAKVYEKGRVSGNAKVFDNAKIFGSAEIKGDAQVFGDAEVSGEAVAFGLAKISGNSKVKGTAQISGKEDLKTGTIQKENIIMKKELTLLESAKMIFENDENLSIAKKVFDFMRKIDSHWSNKAWKQAVDVKGIGVPLSKWEDVEKLVRGMFISCFREGEEELDEDSTSGIKQHIKQAYDNFDKLYKKVRELEVKPHLTPEEENWISGVEFKMSNITKRIESLRDELSKKKSPIKEENEEDSE